MVVGSPVRTRQSVLCTRHTRVELCRHLSLFASPNGSTSPAAVRARAVNCARTTLPLLIPTRAGHTSLHRVVLCKAYPSLYQDISSMTVAGSSAFVSRRLTSRADIKQALAKPTWSVSELFEDENHGVGTASSHSETPTAETLTKLLKLAGLNAIPKGSAKEAQLLDELTHQLVFVSHISAVDTEGVEPLVRISGPPIEPSYADLVEAESSTKDAPETEAPNNWQPTKLAAKTSGSFYQLNTKLGESDN